MGDILPDGSIQDYQALCKKCGKTIGVNIQGDEIGNHDCVSERKPNCYKCVHRMNVPGDCHSRCNNFQANVTGNAHGIRSGWFLWPFNFDPIWLESCDGFSDKPEDVKPAQKYDPLMELLAILK